MLSGCLGALGDEVSKRYDNHADEALDRMVVTSMGKESFSRGAVGYNNILK